jgi:hypothetical protein
VKIKLFALSAMLIGSAALASAGGWGGYGGCHHGGSPGYSSPGYSSPGYSRGGWGGCDYVADYTKKHGVKFTHGYFYPGAKQTHFTEKWYDYHFKTYLHFDPHSHRPYYFCEGHGVWYPIQYIHTVAPGAKGPGPVIPGGPNGGPAPGGPEGGPVPDGVVPGVGGGSPGGPGPGVVPGSGDGKTPPAAPGGDTPPVTPKAPDAKPEGQQVPPGTFDDAIPPDAN